MKPMILFFATVALTGCMTQSRTTCSSPAARDLKTIDKLIDETETTIDRGFVMTDTTASNVNFCLGSGGNNVGVSLCTDGSGKKPVAIDRAAEQRKLDGLLTRRAALAKQAAADSAICAAVP
jgi:hypothetical protein